ncbi:DNA-directed RNA polymerase subunit omega [Dirofilaria immitis]
MIQEPRYSLCARKRCGTSNLSSAPCDDKSRENYNETTTTKLVFDPQQKLQKVRVKRMLIKVSVMLSLPVGIIIRARQTHYCTNWDDKLETQDRYQCEKLTEAFIDVPEIITSRWVPKEKQELRHGQLAWRTKRMFHTFTNLTWVKVVRHIGYLMEEHSQAILKGCNRWNAIPFEQPEFPP